MTRTKLDLWKELSQPVKDAINRDFMKMYHKVSVDIFKLNKGQSKGMNDEGSTPIPKTQAWGMWESSKALGMWEDNHKAGIVKPVDKSALDVQIGGNHYKDLKIQPTEYITANKLSWCEGNIVKYITRHSAKGGKQDVQKVIHYAQLLLDLEYDD